MEELKLKQLDHGVILESDKRIVWIFNSEIEERSETTGIEELFER